MTDVPPDTGVIEEMDTSTTFLPPEPALAPIVRRAKDSSASGKLFLGIGVFLLGVTAIIAVLITIPGIRDNGDATRLTRDELSCRSTSQVKLETARAELQRGQAQWAEALGSYLVASEDVLRNVIAGTPDAVVDDAVAEARTAFEKAADNLRALDPPLVKAIADREAANQACDPNALGTETP